MTHAKLHTRVKKILGSMGFLHSKQFQYGRIDDGIIQYVVLSRHRTVGDYTLSCGIRVPASTFPALAMVGPTSGPADQILGGIIHFRATVCWAKVSPTVDQCAEKIGSLVSKHQLQWFDEQNAVLNKRYRESSLTDDDKDLIAKGEWSKVSNETAKEFKLSAEQVAQWDAASRRTLA